MSYWYLEREQEGLVEQPLPNGEAVEKTIIEKALEIQLAMKLKRFKCHTPEGCFSCKPYEEILKGNAEYVGMNDYREDVYVLDTTVSESKESEIL